MVKAATHLAAGAIAAAFLLAGAGGAVAAADTPSGSAGSENANSTASDSGPAPAPRPVDNNAFSSSGENARAAGISHEVASAVVGVWETMDSDMPGADITRMYTYTQQGRRRKKPT